MRILTAGISVLEREKFKDSSNYDIDKAYYLNKPRGFIWGSTLIKRDGKVYSDWIRLLENEQFHPKKYTNGISYTLHKNAKICSISCEEDYLDLMDNYSIEYKGDIPWKAYIDFKKLSKDYDAFHLTEDAFYKMRIIYPPIYRRNIPHRMLADFYDYDCETWIIFNYDIINQGSIINHNIPIYIDEDEEDEEE